MNSRAPHNTQSLSVEVPHLAIVSSSAPCKKLTPLPKKPYDNFPLTPHRSGKWCKRIKGHLRYFGSLDDWEAALQQLEHEEPYWRAGKVPPPCGDTITLAGLCNLFLEFKESLVESDELAKPMRFGQGFKRPSAKTLRKARASKRIEKGLQMFKAHEINTLLERAKQPLRAMILLGVNCGLGNNDCALLRPEHVDLDRGWLDYERPKTCIGRRAKLWPETIAALREAFDSRPRAKTADARPLFFRTKYGHSWSKETSDNPVTKAMRKLLGETELYRGVNFYGLRHTFETIAGETKDQVAVDAIMRHCDGSMASVYRERISEERFDAVAEHVRAWLFDTRAVTNGNKNVS